MADLTLSRRTRGILCILLAALCFSAMSACVRLAGDDLPTIQKAFFRNFVALLAALALSRRKGVSWKPARKSLPALLGRSVFGTAGLILNFYAIDHLALADANIKIGMISTSEIKIAVMVDESDIEEAARVVHKAFNLGA